MTNRSGATARRKGATYDREVRDALEQAGFTPVKGSVGLPVADVTVDELPWLSVEVKNQAKLDLAGWVDQAVRQAAEAETVGNPKVGVVFHKRRGHSTVGNHYVTMRTDQFLWMLAKFAARS